MNNTFTPEQLAWLTTLEAGTYQQAQGRLERQNSVTTSFCCLGVACNLVAPETRTVKPGTHGSVIYYDGEMTSLPRDMVQKLLMRGATGRFLHKINYLHLDGRYFALGTDLVDLNDSGAFSFAEIAAVIRAWPWLVFTNFDQTGETPPADILAPRKITIGGFNDD